MVIALSAILTCYKLHAFPSKFLYYTVKVPTTRGVLTKNPPATTGNSLACGDDVKRMPLLFLKKKLPALFASLLKDRVAAMLHHVLPRAFLPHG